MNCPSAELLSAFFDGEVGTPWSERIRGHVAECQRCREALDRLESLSRLLHGAEEPVPAESQLRVRDRIAHEQQQEFPHRVSIWLRKVSLPLPAAAALLLLVLGMAGLLLYVSTRASFPFMSIKREPSGLTEVQVAAPIEDLEQLLLSLDRQSVNQDIIITLPENTHFLIIGRPEMLRETEYSRRTRW